MAYNCISQGLQISTCLNADYGTLHIIFREQNKYIALKMSLKHNQFFFSVVDSPPQS